MDFMEQIKGGLIVSCQALEDEPLHSSFIMAKMALAAKVGGAVGIRAQGIEDIVEIKKACTLPLIGIIKQEYSDSQVYITPTKKEVMELLQTSCEMIALDATSRKRPNHQSLQQLVQIIHQYGRLAMADISTYEEAILAKELGFDCISTTLCGYTDYSTITTGPDFTLLKQLVENMDIPVIAEGKITTPDELKKAFDIGVHAAVVGGAITRPQQITAQFVAVLPKS